MNHFAIALITGLACMFCWGCDSVRDEKLAGTIKEEKVLNVLLEDTGEKLTAFLEAADLAHYFHWQEPFFLECVGD